MTGIPPVGFYVPPGQESGSLSLHDGGHISPGRQGDELLIATPEPAYLARLF